MERKIDISDYNDFLMQLNYKSYIEDGVLLDDIDLNEARNRWAEMAEHCYIKEREGGEIDFNEREFLESYKRESVIKTDFKVQKENLLYKTIAKDLLQNWKNLNEQEVEFLFHYASKRLENDYELEIKCEIDYNPCEARGARYADKGDGINSNHTIVMGNETLINCIQTNEIYNLLMMIETVAHEVRHAEHKEHTVYNPQKGERELIISEEYLIQRAMPDYYFKNYENNYAEVDAVKHSLISTMSFLKDMEAPFTEQEMLGVFQNAHLKDFLPQDKTNLTIEDVNKYLNQRTEKLQRIHDISLYLGKSYNLNPEEELKSVEENATLIEKYNNEPQTRKQIELLAEFAAVTYPELLVNNPLMEEMFGLGRDNKDHQVKFEMDDKTLYAASDKDTVRISMTPSEYQKELLQKNILAKNGLSSDKSHNSAGQEQITKMAERKGLIREATSGLKECINDGTIPEKSVNQEQQKREDNKVKIKPYENKHHNLLLSQLPRKVIEHCPPALLEKYKMEFAEGNAVGFDNIDPENVDVSSDEFIKFLYDKQEENNSNKQKTFKENVERRGLW